MKKKIKKLVSITLAIGVLIGIPQISVKTINAFDKKGLQIYQVTFEKDLEEQCDISVEAILNNKNIVDTYPYVTITCSPAHVWAYGSKKPLKGLYNENDNSYYMYADDECRKYWYQIGTTGAFDSEPVSSKIELLKETEDTEHVLVYANYDIDWYTYTDINDSSTYVKQSKPFYYSDVTDQSINENCTSDDLKSTLVQMVVPETYTITLPKILQLDTSTNQATYAVKVSGNIATNSVIHVVPDSSVSLENGNGETVNATILQEKEDFKTNELEAAGDAGISTIGTITSGELSAGDWLGKFNFNISVER